MDFLSLTNWVDVAALIVIGICVLRGWRRGLSGELAQLVGVVGALVFGLLAYRPFSFWLLEHTRLTDRPGRAVAFLASLVAALVVMILLRLALRSIIRIVVNERFDHAAGLLAGLVRGVTITGIVFLVMNLWPHPYLNRKFGEDSVFGVLLLRAMPALRAAGDAVNGSGVADEPPQPASSAPVWPPAEG